MPAAAVAICQHREAQATPTRKASHAPVPATLQTTHYTRRDGGVQLWRKKAERAAGVSGLIDMHWWESLRTRFAFERLVRDLNPGIAFALVDVGSAGGYRYCFDPREVRKMRYGMGGRAASDRNYPTRPERVGIRQGVSTPTRAKAGRADMLSGGSIA